MYGRGVASIADQIKTHKGETTAEDIKEAQRITDDFFKGFPQAKQWIDKTESDAHINGYVEDLWGRRRRLPDILKEDYEIERKGTSTDFNPLLESELLYTGLDKDLVDAYLKKIRECRSNKQKISVKAEAEKDGLIIHDNGGKIAQAERQCVNARIQGGAASMSKRAIAAVYRDEVLRSYNFKLVNVVHDELIGECPEELAEQCGKRLAELMIAAAKPECLTPMKCDAGPYKTWYEDVYSAELQKGYKECLSKGMSEEEAFKKVSESREECTEEQLREFLAM